MARMKPPWIWLLGPCLAAVSTASAATPVSQPDFSDAGLRALVGQLADRSYKVRQAATEQLSRLEYAQLDRLVPLYRSAGSPEAKLRLQGVAYRMFVAAKQAGQMPEGFIGIAHTTTLVEEAGQTVTHVEVSTVVAGSPASRAGLKPGDVIVAFNGRAIEADPGGGAFTDQIRRLKPGEQVKLTVLRDERKVELALTLGNRGKAGLAEDQPPEWSTQFDAVWRAKFDPTAVSARPDDRNGIEAQVIGPGPVILREGNGRIRIQRPVVVEPPAP